MEYHCEDLPQHGVVLVAPCSPEYAALLADIQQRIEIPIAGSPPRFRGLEDPTPPTMILRNRSQTAIAAVSWIWTYEPQTGRSTTSSCSTTLPQVLAPFGLDERHRKLYGYWHVILPGSKRGIRGNTMFGDNTDVRLPEDDELWNGGGIGGGGGSRRSIGPLKSVTLALDGVFFLDGGFAGPDALGTFERITANVDAVIKVAATAREGHNRGLTPAAILVEIEAVTGPDRGFAPPPAPGRRGDSRRESLQNLASRIAMMRHGMADDRVVYQLMSWTETPLPAFRRL
jgi:hypothetical protein